MLKVKLPSSLRRQPKLQSNRQPNPKSKAKAWMLRLRPLRNLRQKKKPASQPRATTYPNLRQVILPITVLAAHPSFPRSVVSVVHPRILVLKIPWMPMVTSASLLQ
jgi:hypothetical protein